MRLKRYNHDKIQQDLAKKMVFLAGPRQVGKTTLARSIEPEQHQYFNYDFVHDRKAIHRMQWDRATRLIVLDEVHKMKGWKRWIKGVWDTNEARHAFLVTGSAKLDYVRRSGESLAGRYYLHRLHPLTIAELKSTIDADQAFSQLMRLGGFPEPFFSNDEIEAARWRSGHVDRILREDLIDLERVSQIKSLELLIELLAERVGATISYSSLAEDLSVAPKTVKHWIEILERLYVVFLVRPYAKKLARAIRKEPKVYFYDTGRVSHQGARLENLVACHLLKRNHFLEDHLGKKTSLHFLRDKEKREVDFLNVVDGTIEFLVEVKSSQDELAPALRYYNSRLAPLRSIQLVADLTRSKSVHGCDVIKTSAWLSQLEA